MDKASQATTHTPHDLFDPKVGTHLIAAWRNGYIVEFATSAFDRVQRRLQNPSTDPQRCDIFRIEFADLFANVLKDASRIETAWSLASADESGRRTFNVRLPGFLSGEAQSSVIETLARFAREDRVALPAFAVRGDLLSYEQAAEARAWLPASRFTEGARALSQTNPSLPVGIRDNDVLHQLVASGAIVRWEPVAPLRPTNPGVGPEPELELPTLDEEPIVGVIDGGYHATRYRGAMAWEMEPLVPDGFAARAHGNKVASILVDAHLWSNQLQLPQLHCRLGVVQAVPDVGINFSIPDRVLLNYLEQAFIEHPETHVWNLSANFNRECDEYDVSDLGHGLSEISRRHNKLLVVSAGNRSETIRLAPPADCEAAIIVSGRTHDENGNPSEPCSLSRVGLGPEGMLKPEASWFSEHRVLGGGTDRGTSFAAPLVSRLAAHTWSNLADPSPDLVKALLISSCDLDAYSHEMGFGSPVRPEMPWICPSNVAVVAWTADISALQRYYWTGIRVPQSLIQDGRFVGRAKMVAILSPVTQLDGHHYISTRLGAGLQYKKQRPEGGFRNMPMLGSLNPNERARCTRSRPQMGSRTGLFKRIYSKQWT
ncbi:S8 family peptidase [Microvirga flavescens]|uniref:S8 family peptidase n=1 Tax=Microvirga flavescens TaxID=2249811 RepID=UPI0013003607|nr:S8 family peptidase [Microvirga flavescens]